MKPNPKHFAWTPKLAALAVAFAAAALHSPASAQQNDTAPSPRQRFGRETGLVQPPLSFDEQAKTIIEKSVQRYKAAPSWHVEQEIVSAGRFAKKVTADFRGPQNLLVTTEEAKGIKTVAYYDADNVSTVRDFDKVVEYQVSSLKLDPQTTAGDRNLRLGFGTALGQYFSGFFNGEENVFGWQPVQSVKYGGLATVNGVPVENIVVQSVRRNLPVTITYFIGKEDSLLHKVVQKTLNADGTSTEYVETYSHQTAEVKVPESAFQFAPPAGATKVERFTPSRGLQVKVGDTPFAITTKDLNGNDISLDQYKGKVVLLDFWATWCAPCRAELPNLKAAYAKYKDQGFDVLGISFDQTTEPLPKFIDKEALAWRHVYDGYWNGPIAKAYNVRFIPSTVLIGRDGKVAAVGARGEVLEPAIQAALLKQ